MSTPNPGDRVRVIIEGTVGESGQCSERRVHVKYVGHVPTDWARQDSTLGAGETPPSVSVEVLSPAEPEWLPGDVARAACAGGIKAAVRGDDGIWRNGRTGQPMPNWPNFACCRPLILLVRDGKPVQS